MKWTIVRTMEELNAARREGKTKLKIERDESCSSLRQRNAKLTTAIGTGKLTVCGNVRVYAYGDAHVVVMGNASVEAREQATVEARDNSRVIAADRSKAKLYGNAYAYAWGASTVETMGNSNAIVAACDNANVNAIGNSRVFACGNAYLKASGGVRVVACNTARVAASGGVNVDARGRAYVTARDYAMVRAWGDVCVEVFDKARAVICGGAPVDAREGSATIILRSNDNITTAAEWCAYWGVSVTDGVATLYKCVDDDYATPYSRRVGIFYRPGATPEAHDWDGGKAECGGGLHGSPCPAMALGSHMGTRFVACPVRLEDIAVHPRGDFPGKVKFRACCAPVYEVDWDGKPITP